MFVYGEQVFYFVLGLYQDIENVVCFVFGIGGNVFGYFFLDYFGIIGYQVFVIQYFKEYLVGYIIRIVVGQDKRFFVK